MTRKRLIFVCLLPLAVALPLWLYHTIQPTSIRHAPRTASPIDLPQNATDLSYYDAGALGAFTYATFETTEPAFKEWATRTSQHPLTSQEGPLTSTFYNIDTGHSAELSTPDGLLLHWQQNDRSAKFLFDRTTNRAHVQLDSR